MRVPSTQVQNNFGQYLKYAEVGEEIIITRNGKDLARLVRLEEADIIREQKAQYGTTGSWHTYEDFLVLIENSELSYELINGQIFNLASPTFDHQNIVANLNLKMAIWFDGKKCKPYTSPFDVTFDQDPDNVCVVQPDILVICDWNKLDENRKYRGVPTLIVEVLSKATRRKDMFSKLELYERNGVQEYWIVDPVKESIAVYRFGGENIVEQLQVYTKEANEKLVSFYFAGLSILLTDVFETPVT